MAYRYYVVPPLLCNEEVRTTIIPTGSTLCPPYRIRFLLASARGECFRLKYAPIEDLPYPPRPPQQWHAVCISEGHRPGERPYLALPDHTRGKHTWI